MAEAAANAHLEKKRVYITIWLILLCFTALTTGIAFIDLGPFNTVVAFAIAFIKASLVVAFFMHLRHSEGLIRIIVGVAALWLAILIVVSISDFATRQKIPTPPWPVNRPPIAHHLTPGPTQLPPSPPPMQ
ncbi:MAG: cytochrome C oxidase subunit IV family protein [Terriglobia bacterium]